MKILLSGSIDSISTRVDGSIAIRFCTQEMDSSQGGELFSLRGKYVKALFSDTNVTELEGKLIDAEPITGTKKKSKSQRLRATLYVAWEHSGLQIEFDDYYSAEMEKFIEQVKSKLPQNQFEQ